MPKTASESAPEVRNTPYLAVLIVLAAWVLFIVVGVPSDFYFRCSDFLKGQFFPLLMYPFAHKDFSHLATNTLVFAALAAILERRFGTIFLVVLLVGATGATLLADCVRPVSGLGIRGLSVHGWACWAAWLALRPMSKSVLALMAVSFLYTVSPWFGYSLQGSSGSVAVDAHIVGAVWGATVGWSRRRVVVFAGDSAS